MHVVTVEFRIRPDRLAAFKPLMAENAAASAREEPGCRRFDVAYSPDGAPVCFLYEVYDDAAAFQAHLASAHFKRFDAAVTEMIADKTVRAWTLEETNS